jgi:mannosyltransferase
VPSVLTSDDLLTLEPSSGLLQPVGEDKRDRGLTSRPGFVVGAFCVVAVLLQVPTISRRYWVDESISIGIASHPLRQLPALLRLDGSPPLWYAILHFWMLAFGSSPVATHSLSLLFSVAVVPLAYWAARELFGRTQGICAAALAATNPFLGWYATENRMYTLVVGLGLVAVTLAVRAVRDRSRRDAVLAVAAYAALDYTHNWGLYLTAVTVVYLAVRAHRAGDARLRAWVVGCGTGVFALYLPWLPSFLEQAGNTAAPWAVAPGIGDLFADPSTTLGGTIGVVVAPVLALAVWWTRGRRCRGTSQAATVVTSITLATIVLGWVAAHIEPSWTVRYLAVTVGCWLLAAAGALGGTRSGRRVVVGICILLSVWSIVGALLPNPNRSYAKDNAAAVAAAAAPYLHPGDLVVVGQTEQVPVLAYYLGTRLTYLNPMGRVSDPMVVDWKHIVADLEHADACRTIEPLVAALPVGSQILEIDPLSPVGASGSAWARAAHLQVVSIDRLLGTEPSLEAVRSFTEGISPRPYSPVIGELFVKVRSQTTCP